MNFFEFVKRLRFGIVEDAIDYTKHDDRYHDGHYDRATMTCEMRKAEEEGDLVDVLNAEQFEEEYKQKKDAERAAEIVRRTVDELASRKYTEEEVRQVDAAVKHVLTAKPMFISKAVKRQAIKAIKGDAETPQEMKVGMAHYFERMFPDGILVQGLGLVLANEKSADSIVEHSQGVISDSKWVSIAAIRQLLMSGTVFSDLAHWKDRKWRTVSLASSASIAGYEVIIEIILRSINVGKFALYDMKTFQKKVINDTLTPLATSLSARREPTDSKITLRSIPNSGREVNRDITENSHADSTAKLSTSNLVRQYMAVHGMLKPSKPKQ